MRCGDLVSASLFKVIISIGCLAIASYQDYKTREIDDRVWIFLGLIGGLLTVYELYTIWSPQLMILTPISIIVAFFVGLAMYKFGIMGGADAKAIIALSIVHPYYPLVNFRPIYPYYPIFVLSILENSVLLSLFTLFYFVFRNIKLVLRGVKLFDRELPLIRKITLFLTASRYDLMNTDWGKIYPIEFVDYSVDPPKVRYSFFSNVNVEVDVKNLIRGYKEGYLSNMIWGTYGLPMIIFMFVGFCFSILVGDIILGIIDLLFHVI